MAIFYKGQNVFAKYTHSAHARREGEGRERKRIVPAREETVEKRRICFHNSLRTALNLLSEYNPLRPLEAGGSA